MKHEYEQYHIDWYRQADSRVGRHYCTTYLTSRICIEGSGTTRWRKPVFWSLYCEHTDIQYRPGPTHVPQPCPRKHKKKLNEGNVVHLTNEGAQTDQVYEQTPECDKSCYLGTIVLHHRNRTTYTTSRNPEYSKQTYPIITPLARSDRRSLSKNG